MPTSVLDVVTDAFYELGVLSAADVLSGDDAALGLSRFNQILDNWNADDEAIYADVFSTYTLTPNLAPHTIGPTGTFVTSQRPPRIEGMNLILNNVTPNVNVPIQVRDAAWWTDVSIPSLTSQIPTDCYYEPDWPNGSLYFWPVPTVAYGVELRVNTFLAAVALSTVFTMPPGYQNALMLTLAEDLSAPLQVPLSQTTQMKAMAARARIFAINRITPRLSTRDSGMPGGRGGATFNYRTGLGR